MSDAKYRTDFQSSVAESDPLIRPLSKGLGRLDRALPASEIAGRRWNLLREDLSLPTAVLCDDKLTHNLQWMQRFAEAYGVQLAPHGKTTMAPKLFMRQIKAGAWGITLATPPQVRVAYEHGIRRVLMANQLVGQENMAIIARLLEDPDFDFFCLVDSVELVGALGRFFQKRGQRLHVLVELGVDDGRTGVRNRDQLAALLATLSHWHEQIVTCGVEVYEGLLKHEDSVRAFLQGALEITKQLVREKWFERTPAILSGAGSAWYDVVADVFAGKDLGGPIEVVLRPGCYLTHDVGVYREAQEQIKMRNAVARGMDSSLIPALQLWAYVQSVPETGKAILGLGKRDAAFDAGLPVPALHYRPGQPAPIAAPSAWELTKVMDQHAYMQIPEGADVRVGDMIGLDISHPCLTFDKWRYLPVLDSTSNVIDVAETFF